MSLAGIFLNTDKIKPSVALLFWICVALSLYGCIYPGPELERHSETGQPLEDHGIFHAYYEFTDTLHILPASAIWEVIGIDGVAWTKQMRLEVNNRIPLVEGFHFVRFKGDYLLDRPYSAAIALEVKAGYEYELAEGFPIPLPFSGDRVWHWDTWVNVIKDGKLVREMTVPTIATRPTSSRTCRVDADCPEGLACALVGDTGFGMCGQPE